MCPAYNGEVGDQNTNPWVGHSKIKNKAIKGLINKFI